MRYGRPSLSGLRHAAAQEGHDIPFETFLGFKGNKEPDIDLNSQENIRARPMIIQKLFSVTARRSGRGTIGTLAEKTAFGYVKGYYEDREIHKRGCELARIAEGCVGVRRTTGQHPGASSLCRWVWKFIHLRRCSIRLMT